MEQNKKYEKYLPIGSVVLLKEGLKKLMITGYCITKKNDKTKIYDYIACLYPEGIIDTEKNILFDHENIERIYAIGYIDDDQKQYNTKIIEYINNSLKNEKE